MHGEIKKLLLSKLLCTCPFPFEQKYPESNNRASTENLLPFFINEGSHFEEIFCVKEPTPVLLTIQFSAAMKTLVIYSSLLNFPSYLHRQFARGGGGGNEKKKTIVIQWNLPCHFLWPSKTAIKFLMKNPCWCHHQLHVIWPTVTF